MTTPQSTRTMALAAFRRRLGGHRCPFQQQSDAVARAAAAASARYIDPADGRLYVWDFAAALDAEFRTAGRLAVTGASTVPGLSSAVVDAMADAWQRIHDFDICIAPAQTAHGRPRVFSHRAETWKRAAFAQSAVVVQPAATKARNASAAAACCRVLDRESANLCRRPPLVQPSVASTRSTMCPDWPR